MSEELDSEVAAREGSRAATATSAARSTSDGVSGEFTMQPTDTPTRRTRGSAAGVGADDTEITAEERGERFEQIREGLIASVHSWELVTAVDGPGTRMTLFLAGCPLRCVYCHNPDTWQMRDGTMQTLDDVMSRIKRYRAVFRASGGGVTFSGGEPMFQLPFLSKAVERCKELGIHVAVDTSGFLGKRANDDFIRNVDLFLLDVKSGLPDTYKRLTERDLQPTIDFGDRTHALGAKKWIRFVLVPGWSDDYENVEAVADIVERWKGTVERIEVLPFHNMGQDKWDSLGIPYKLRDHKPPEKALVERVRGQFRARGFQVY